MASLFLPFFGDNDGTVFTDYSEHAHTVTRFGNPTTTTSDSKYYGSSLRLPGVIGDYLEVADDPLFQLADGDFTVELWAKGAPETSTEFAVYVGRHEGVALKRSWMVYQAAGTIRFLCSPDGGTPTTSVNSGVALSSANFSHIAVTRSGTALRIFVNGVLLGTTTLTGSIYQGVDIPVRIGCEGAVGNQSGFFDGYINDLRITKGTALYTETFTPPDALYVEDPGPGPDPDPEPEPGDPDVTRAGQFTLTITGTEPVLLPCANFLARLRSGRRSYLQATIPYTSALADIISARPDEDLELRYYDSAGDPHIVLTVALDGVQITRGVQSASIVLTGWRQSTNSTPATHTDIRATTVSNGTSSATMTMPGYRPEVKPADTITAEGVSFAASLVTVQAAARRNDIEITTTLSEEASV